jgi:hypothetical protein
MQTMEATEVRERPILFSGEMVRAILDGRKSVTRRVVKPQPVPGDQRPFSIIQREQRILPSGEDFNNVRCPYGQPGDRLWVRETWGAGTRPCPSAGWRDGIEYRADMALLQDELDLLPLRSDVVPPDGFEWDSVRTGWHPSIHMPRWASRITLEITDVRVERVQEISEEDAIAEGVSVLPLQSADDPSAWWQTAPGVNQSRTPQGAFSKLWDSINAGGCGWDANPWVWVVTFCRINP